MEELLDDGTDEEAEELSEERLELEDEGAVELEAVDVTELDVRDEELPLPGAEHSLVPPAMRPPKVAALQTKLPVRTL